MATFELPDINPMLCNYGAPKFLADVATSTNLNNVSEIQVRSPTGGILRRITTESQLTVLNKTLHETYGKAWLYTITSKIYQRRSQLMAAHIASHFYDYRTGNWELRWHLLLGDFKDNLREKYNDNLSLLIIDGLTIDSSNLKFEKCYDLLEMYNDIPRILVSSGCDPIELMIKLHLPPNRILFLDDPLVPTPEI
jgi:hypothetical protein